MRNPNGYGSVHKLPGNRRKPWRVRITSGWEIVDGKAVQKFADIGTFATQAEAMNALAEYHKDPYKLDERITFREVYEKWSERKYPTISESNVKAYKASYAVCSALYDMPFSEIHTRQLQSVIDNSGKNYPTLRKIKVLFSQLFDYALKNDIVIRDYSDYVEIAQYKDKDAESKHKPFTKIEVAELWENVERSEWFGVILMLIYSGARIGELLELKKENVNLGEQWFDVRKSKTASGIRKVPIADMALPLWREWMDKPGEYVIQNASGNPIDYSTYLTNYFRRPLEQIGQDHFPHDTRHTCISRLQMAGVPHVLVQRIVGHKSGDVTDKVYTHAEIDEMLEAINKLA